MTEILVALIKYGLTAAGTAGVSIAADTYTQIASGVTALIGVVWGLWSAKRKDVSGS